MGNTPDRVRRKSLAMKAVERAIIDKGCNKPDIKRILKDVIVDHDHPEDFFKILTADDQLELYQHAVHLLGDLVPVRPQQVGQVPPAVPFAPSTSSGTRSRGTGPYPITQSSGPTPPTSEKDEQSETGGVLQDAQQGIETITNEKKPREEYPTYEDDVRPLESMNTLVWFMYLANKFTDQRLRYRFISSCN
jgi:hypothetical protein